MAHCFTHRRRVNFAETDMAGIAHFSNFFRWMEETEHAFYRSLGMSVHPAVGMPDAGTGWPRLRAAADYRLPLRFEEEMEIEILVVEMRGKSIRYAFRFWKNPDDPAARLLAATGELVVVAVQTDPETGMMRSRMIPDIFRERITVAPPELLSPQPPRP